MGSIDAAAEAVDDLSAAIEQGAEDLPRADIAVPDIVPSEYRQPWDRQDDENDYHHVMFLLFRDMGLSRSHKELSEYLAEHPKAISRYIKGKNPKDKSRGGITASTISNISRKHDWRDRVLAWDNEQERLYQLARSEAIREMVGRHERQIEHAIDGLMAPIDALNHAIGDDPDFIKGLSKMDKRKLISMANQAAKTIPSLMSAERLARGMPTEIVDGVIEHQHVVAVERNQIGEVLEILGRAGVLNVGSGNLGAGEIVDAEVVDVHPVSAESDE